MWTDSTAWGLEFWLTTSSQGADNIIMGSMGSDGIGTGIRIATNLYTAHLLEVQMGGDTGARAVETTTAVDDGVTRHIGISYDGNQTAFAGYNICINGVPETLNWRAEGLPVGSVTHIGFALGALSWWGIFGDSILDGVRITVGAARTTSHFLACYTAGEVVVRPSRRGALHAAAATTPAGVSRHPQEGRPAVSAEKQRAVATLSHQLKGSHTR